MTAFKALTMLASALATTITIGDHVIHRDIAGTRGLVKASGKASRAKKAERKRQRKARRAQR